jgi:hypothetical protein
VGGGGISANGDAEVGRILAEAMKKVGNGLGCRWIVMQVSVLDIHAVALPNQRSNQPITRSRLMCEAREGSREVTQSKSSRATAQRLASCSGGRIW